jgi:hypothetical protein
MTGHREDQRVRGGSWPARLIEGPNHKLVGILAPLETHSLHVPRAQRARNAALTSFSALVLRRAARAYGTRALHQHSVWLSAGFACYHPDGSW